MVVSLKSFWLCYPRKITFSVVTPAAAAVLLVRLLSHKCALETNDSRSTWVDKRKKTQNKLMVSGTDNITNAFIQSRI